MTTLGDIEANVVVPTAAEVTAAIEEASSGGAGERVLDFVRISTALTITSEDPASPQTFITANPITLDGSTDLCIEFSTPYSQIRNPGGNLTGFMEGWIYVYNGSTTTKLRGIIYRAAYMDNSQVHQQYEPIYRKVFIAAPSAGTYTYSVRFHKGGVNGGTHSQADVNAGDDSSGGWDKAYMRITVANPEA